MYGVVDAGYGNFSYKDNTGVTNKIAGTAYSSLDTSRWGLTGKEDIGGGRAAGFNLESTLTGPVRDNFGYNGAGYNFASSSATNLFNPTDNGRFGNVSTGGAIAASGAGFASTVAIGDRKLNAYVQSGAHTVTAGFKDTVVRSIAVGFDAAGGNILGNLVGNDRSLGGGSNGQGRAKGIEYAYSANGLTAATQLIRGYTASGNMYAANGDQGESVNGYNAGAVYAQGPWAVGAAVGNMKSIAPNAAAMTAGNGFGAAAAGATGMTDILTKQTAIGASYDFGIAKGFYQYAKIDIKDRLAAAPSNGGNGAGGDIRSMQSVGVRVPVGAGTAFVQSSRGKDQNGNSTLEGSTSGYSLGYVHDMSKRTTLYVLTGATKADTHTSGALNTAVGVEAKMSAVGIKHAF
jgi:predicted porin